MNELHQRCLRYTDALKRTLETGPLWTVGYALAEEVDDLDAVVVMLGADSFKGMVTLTQNLINAYRIKG